MIRPLLLLPALFGLTECRSSDTPPLEDLVYRVHIDETLSDIAARFEVPGGWEALAEHNHLDDPNLLSIEQSLLVPVGHLRARGEDPRSRLPPLPPPDPAPTEAACVVTEATIPRAYPEDEEAERACQDEEQCTTCAPALGGYLCEDRSDRLALTWKDALEPADRRSPLEVGGAYGPPSTHLYRVDLDGDGAEEIVVVRYESTSNGIALPFYRIEVLDPRHGTQARLWANGLSLTATRAQGCELLLHDFDYARDLESGGTHAYWLEYPLVWTGTALEPLPGAWFRRWHPEGPRVFRHSTPRTRPAPADLEPNGTILAVREAEWSLHLTVQQEEDTAEVVLYSFDLLGVGAEVAAQPASSGRDWAGLVGQRLLRGPGLYWVLSGQGSSTSR